MQLIEVAKNDGQEQGAVIEAMLRLRAKVFAERLHWKVDSTGGREWDRFDEEGPTYLIVIEDDHRIVGCVRLLPASRSSMLREVFADLLEGGRLDVHARMIESSRFCVDKPEPQHCGLAGRAAGKDRAGGEGEGGSSILQLRTRMLLAGIVEWSLLHGYEELVTATDLRMERLLRLCGWPLRRLGSPRMINETASVAGSLVISREVFDRLRPHGYASPIPAPRPVM